MSITKEELIEILARIEAKIDASETRLEAKMKEALKDLKEDINLLIEYNLVQATFSDLRAKKLETPYKRNDRVYRH